MSGSKYTFDEHLIKCPICTKIYNQPRVLPCLHSFCSNCLTDFIKHGPKVIVDKNKPVTTKQGDGGSGNSQPNAATKTGKGEGSNAATKSGKSEGSNAATKTGTKSPVKGHESPTKRKSPTDQKLKSVSPTKTEQQQQQPTKTVSPPIQTPKPDVVSTQVNTKGFPCPCCKKFVTTPYLPKTPKEKWAEQFPQNTLLSDLVDLHSLKQGARTCDPCKRNKTSSTVISYCKVCRDAMCESCDKTHKGLRSCRNHKVIPLSELSQAMDSLKVEQETCTIHKDKPLDQYCGTHSTVCCSQCVSEKHKGCDRLMPLDEAIKKVKDSGQVNSLEGALDKYKRHMDLVEKDRTTLLKSLESKKVKLMTEFQGIKKHILTQLDKMEKDLSTVLETTHQQEKKKIKQETERCKEIKTAVVNSNYVLKMAQNHGSDAHIVDTTGKVRDECEYYEESIGILCSRMRTVDYNIQLDQSLQQIVKRLNQFGRIDVNTSATKLPPHPKLASTLGLHTSSTKAKAVKPNVTLTGKWANEIGEFCARSEDDSVDCWFTGATFLSDGRILLADRTNRKLKLFSTNLEPVSELVLSSKPWDISLLSDTEVAVTLPAECKLQVVNIADAQMRQTKSLSTDEPCFGICCTKDKIFTVTYDGDPPNLKILSTNGSKTQEPTYVCVDDDGMTLFSKPVYVTCTPDAEQIYVSDERLGCLVSLKEMGNLNFNYSAIDVGNAAGITLDKVGNIYICDNNSHSVHKVSADGEKVSVVVSADSISYPRAVAYEPKEKKLLVTQGDKDIVKVFNIA